MPVPTRNKNFYKTNEKDKTETTLTMKNIYKTFLMAIAILLGSCTSDPIQPQPEDHSKPEDDKIENTYYVRFEGNSKGTQARQTVWKMEAGKFNYSITASSCSETFGPISKDDQIKFSGNEKYTASVVTIKVYVSRNNEPFALVESKSGYGGAAITHTIDF